MNRPDLYQKTIDTLVDAYYKDELKHSDCHACAVGNILKEPAKEMGVSHAMWTMKFITTNSPARPTLNQRIAPPGYVILPSFLGYQCVPTNKSHAYAGISHPYPRIYDKNMLSRNEWEALQLIALSGYSVSELAKIEFAFENVSKGNDEDEHMFNGLMAVVKTLDEIHDNTDEVITKKQVQRFVDKPAACTV